MKCEKVQDLLPAYLDASLGWLARGRVDAHLRACAACRSELRALRRTVELVHRAGAERIPRDIAAAVMARLELEPTPAPALRTRLRRPVVLVPTAVGVAAALLLSLPQAKPPVPSSAESTTTTYVREYAHFHASQDIGGGTGALMLASEYAENARGEAQ